MRRLTPAAAVFALLAVAGGGSAYPVRGLDVDQMQKIATLTKELHRAELGKIAIFVEARSESADKLVIESGAGANPLVNPGLRLASWGDLPFVSVYPTSSPVSMKLDGLGECEVLGAVALLGEAAAAECDDKDKDAVAQPGVYMIAYHMTDGWIAEVVLVSLTVDDEGRAVVKPVLRTLAKRGMNVASLLPPAAAVQFPKPDEVSDDNPAWRASVTVLSLEHAYEFALDLRGLPMALSTLRTSSTVRF